MIEFHQPPKRLKIENQVQVKTEVLEIEEIIVSEMQNEDTIDLYTSADMSNPIGNGDLEVRDKNQKIIDSGFSKSEN